jgi:hypothetical protein
LFFLNEQSTDREHRESRDRVDIDSLKRREKKKKTTEETTGEKD